MVGNDFGTLFRVELYGESHGDCIGVVIDGCPAGFEIDLEYVQKYMDMRRPGQSSVTTARSEEDEVNVRAGIFEGKTTGAPIVMEIPNGDTDSSKYYAIRNTPRPSHADLPAYFRYGGYHDFRGGGRFSGRITAGIVMAGAVALQVLEQTQGIRIASYALQVGSVVGKSAATVDEILGAREENTVRTADPDAAPAMEAAIEEVRADGDSIGGVIECVVENLPPGIGNPWFDTLEGVLSKALFSIPAVKGVEFGAGFRAAAMRGSEHNDPYRVAEGRYITTSNNSGGIIGGISNGMPVVVRLVVKPTASIPKTQETVDLQTNTDAEIKIEGRHDPCIVPRAVPVVDCMVAIVLVDELRIAGIIPQVL
jgi:chorismate synthase